MNRGDAVMPDADEALLWARKTGLPIYLHHTLAHAYRAGAAASAERIKALEAEMAELKRTLINTAANLRGAASLLENGGKKAAPSNKMFEIMLSDYRAAAKRAYDAADRAAALMKEGER